MAGLCRESIDAESMAKKLQLSYKDIEAHLEVFKNHNVPTSEVGYEILKAFGKSDRDIERFKEGKGVLKTFDGLLIKGLFCYCGSDTLHLTEKLEALKMDAQVIKAAPKIIAVSDGITILAFDTREKDTYEHQLAKMHSDFTFFYPLNNVERIHNVEESPADVKAAEKLAKLHDEIRAYNEYNSDDDLHDLNIFITRLLFCFFAEDTGIFAANLFSNFIKRYTKDDGSDLSEMIGQTFHIMNIPQSDRSEEITKEINDFPYVNGGLFATDIPIPQMGYKARKIIIACGDLDWKDINPDIFGSMIQAVVNPDVRAKEGMHYTSVPNIMKVINPLFMDDLHAAYKKIVDAYEQKKNMYDMSVLSQNQFLAECKPLISACDKLLKRMSKMKFFDPACGSGNFLIITYKQLRLLEMDILRLRKKCEPDQMIDFIDGSYIRLDQFYGIELLDFPHEVAMLSLWLAEHQMNNKFHADFGVNVAALPLHNINQIKCANACRVDWNEVCPHTMDEEVFVFGNPPYLGSSMQDDNQKQDLTCVCGKFSNYKNLDYIASWFYLGAQFLEDSNVECAFVSTNSICQGDSVALLWPNIFKLGVIIKFAYQSFKWSNNAKNKAMVSVVIIGLTSKQQKVKKIYKSNGQLCLCDNINSYLLNAPNLIISRCNKSISNLPEMVFGNKATDGGFLILDQDEYSQMLKEYPESSKIIREYQGADTFINGYKRYCLWIPETLKELAYSIPPIAARLKKVSVFRTQSKAESTRLYADRPYLFKQRPHIESDSIIVPRVSSEKRKYLPVGMLSSNSIISDAGQAIYNADLFVFGLLCTHIHVVWLSAIGGKLETRYRYSSLVYNSFPFPPISASKKSEIEAAAEEVLLVRADYPGKTLADLYDPDKMPSDLRETHEKLDAIVESCYPGAPFANDEARLECLFKLYEKMTDKK